MALWNLSYKLKTLPYRQNLQIISGLFNLAFKTFQNLDLIFSNSGKSSGLSSSQIPVQIPGLAFNFGLILLFHGPGPLAVNGIDCPYLAKDCMRQ